MKASKTSARQQGCFSVLQYFHSKIQFNQITFLIRRFNSVPVTELPRTKKKKELIANNYDGAMKVLKSIS